MTFTFKNIIIKQDLLRSFVLHILTGGLSVTIHYTIMGLMLLIGISPLVSSSLGFVFGALLRFITAYYHVFEPSSSVQETVPKFILSLFFQGIFNFIFLYILISMDIKLWVAQLLTTISITFLNFIVYRIWVFK